MKTSTIGTLLATGLLFLNLTLAHAQKSQTNYDLLLKFGSVNLVENIDDYIESFTLSEHPTVDGHLFKIIQFNEIPAPPAFEAIQESGIEFLEYIPNKAYVVAIPGNYDLAILKSFNVRSISDIEVEFKQDMLLLDKNYPEWAMRDNNQIDLMVTYYRNLPFDPGTMELSPLVTEVIQNDPLTNTQILRVPVESIENIVALPQVYFVEPVYPAGEPENYTAKTLHRSNVLDSQYESGRHYDGTDVKVMLQDDGIIGPHIDYEGRIGAQNLTNNWGDHGDHCAGTIFGSGNLDPTTAGMAPGAELHTWGAAPSYPGFNSMETAYNETGIRISSTSYSNGCNAGYTTLARTMDLQVNTYESLMHVFSAGNSGTLNCGYGAGSGWGNVTGGHKIGKNVIATANITSTGGLSGSSSRGPAHDGRIKPDISAKGTSVYSTVDPHDYAQKTGTSMACPGIAGSLAQLYQAYQELNEGDEPPGGLMKGLILNTADDLGNVGPDFKFGWGQINNKRAVEVLEEETYMTDEISQDESNEHIIDIPEGVKEVKVMVYWTDKEASVNAEVALVNNLDISISDPADEDHLPWLLNHYPNADSLDKPAVKGTDALNNMEQVQINDPEAGSYTLHVEGTEIPFGPQEYYVLYHFTFEEIELTYPLGGESFDLSETILVRWDAYGDEGPFTLEYTLDDGISWQLISDNVSGSVRDFNWTTPSTATGQAKLRISRDGLESTSADVFSVMDIPENIFVARACEESVLLRWDAVNGAESYDVFLLGEKYMEIVGSTSNDSLFVQDVNSFEDLWFSVRAIGPDSAVGRRALAIMKSPGTWDCLVTKDLAMSDVISPPLGVLFDCQDLENLPVQVEITNMAVDDLSDMTIYYEFDGQPAVSETFAGPLAAGETLIYEFSSTVSLSSSGIFEMTAWIELDGDQEDDNNTITGTSELQLGSYLETNSLITFDVYADCSTSPNCEQTSCDIDDDFVNLQNTLNDDIDWRVLSGLTPTPFTGPLGDHTTGTNGKYLYLESSGDCNYQEAILTTSCVDLSSLSSPALMFWYSMNGEDIGSLHVDIVSDGVLHKDIIDPMEGDMGYDWLLAEADLSVFSGKTVSVRFRGTTGNGELSDLAIDDIIITDVTGESEMAAELGISIYPNPSSGLYNLVVEEPLNRNISLRVVDLSGKNIFNEAFQSLSAGTNVRIDISEYGNGMYYLILETENNQYRQKLLKQ